MRLKFPNYIIIAFFLLFVSCISKPKLDIKAKYYEAKLSFYDSSIQQQILPYQLKIQDSMNQQIAELEDQLIKETPEGNLGNFVCDALFKKHVDYLAEDLQKADFVLLNNGGLRTNVPAGTLTIGKLFELMPFDNELVIVTLDSSSMAQLLDFIAKKGGMPVSQLNLKIQNNSVTDVSVGNVQLDKQKNYKVLTSDYLVNGGDNMLFFKNSVYKLYLKKLIRTVLIEYCIDETKKGNKIASKKDGRIQLSK